MGDNMIMAVDNQETLHHCKKEDILKVFTYDELKCATMGFGYKTRLGEWSFGKVYKGWVDDEMDYSPTDHGTGLPIVVKTFEDHHSNGSRDFTPKLSDYNVSMFKPWFRGGLDWDIDHPSHNPPPSIFEWSNLVSFTMVLAEILTGEFISETNPLVKMNNLRHDTRILDDPKSLGSVANICFEICNDVDSESKMLSLLNKFDEQHYKDQNDEEIILENLYI
ncbi:hypothetical protein SSX86_003537 [Deinandra increscens subsp. villosa]|uniref:Serine-threonine/tyrosine-protein kinase catalytic domain-containing protein n=1 Tax=Deinandra increscens subsp. villosa TaxID=3103831 RepID=A0AAP0DII0_9ASTR